MACADVGHVKIEDDPNYIELWADKVLSYSSQYNNSGWSAQSILGPPKVYPNYGDLNGAWAQGNISDSEFIEIGYAKAIYISDIDIYETFNGGAVKKVEAKGQANTWVTLWESASQTDIQTSRIWSVPIETTKFKADTLRISQNCTIAQTWCEIDCVRIKGKLSLRAAPPNLGVLADDLKTLVNNPLFSDCHFMVEGEIVYGHRSILATRSDYFRAMFCDGLKETKLSDQPIPMPDISHGAFLCMMHYLYTNSFKDNYSPIVLVELIRVADRFVMEGLKSLSHFYLDRAMNVDNIITIYKESKEKLPVLESVLSDCAEFIADHLKDVTSTGSFAELPQPLMLEVIRMSTDRLSLK